MCDCYKAGVHRVGINEYTCHTCDEDASLEAKASFAAKDRIPIFSTHLHVDPLKGQRPKLAKY